MRRGGIEPIAARQFLARPGIAHQRQVLAVDLRTLAAFQTEGKEGLRSAARAKADFQPPVEQTVEHGGIFGDAHRILHRQRNDARPQANT